MSKTSEHHDVVSSAKRAGWSTPARGRRPTRPDRPRRARGRRAVLDGQVDIYGHRVPRRPAAGT